MAQCPNCHNEVKPGERFCGNCGARIEQPPPNAEAPAPPPERPRTGKETIVLPALTDINLRPPVAPAQPPADATIVGAPAPQPPSAGGADATTISPPASQLPAGAIPPAAAPPKAQKAGGSGVWTVLGIIVGICLLACVALSVGVFLFLRQLGSSVSVPFATIEAGLATPGPGGGLAGGAVAFRETFDSPSGSAFDETDTKSASRKFVNGAYQVTVKQPNLIAWRAADRDYGDAAISVDTTINGSKPAAAGLIFHFQDDKNFYIFTISEDSRYNLEFYKDDQLTTLIDWTESSAIKGAGETNALRVETAGDKIRLYANNQLLDEVSDSTFSRGQVALVVNSFQDAGASASFDNLVIQGAK
jgi:hypothetical protein